MVGFWSVFSILFAVGIVALVLLLLSARRTVRSEGWDKGKLTRGAGAKAFWTGICVLVLDAVALAVFVLLQ